MGDIKLLKTRGIRLLRDGNQICALIGNDLQSGVGGFGDNLPEALRDLAANIEKDEEITIWVRQQGKQYVEEGVLKSACPECGHIHVMTDFAEVIAYVCDECGSGIDVEPLPK